MKRLVSIGFVLAAGCTVMVNGKPRKIGGGSDPQPTATTTGSSSSSSSGAAAQTQAPAKRPAVAAATKIVIQQTLTSAPLITKVDGVAFDTTYSKLFGSYNSPDCGSEMPSAPIASFELKQAMPSLNVTLVGGSNDGFVLRRGDAMWFACSHTTNSLPEISALKEGWQPGRYDIYPVSRYAKSASPTFEIEISDPTKPVPWSESLKKITIAQKLATPMFVEVTTRPDRRKLRADVGGWGCEKAAFAVEPDLALVLERPIPGLIVRPLPTTTPVVLRRELRDAKRPDRGCPHHEQRTITSNYTPSYSADYEIHFDQDDEGTYGISVGTADPARPTTVTLMIYDKDTKLEPLAPHTFGGDALALERRWLGLYFPQLDLREPDGDRDYAHAELAAKLFAIAPKQTFVYAKLDMDKDLAQGSSDAFPKKNEPLLLVGLNSSQAEVLAADGLRWWVKPQHLVLEPDGPAALPTAPRSLGKLDIGRVIALLPPSAKPLVTAHEKRLAAWDKCTERAWAPYGRQLPTYTHPAGVDVVYYESARTKQIRAAGQAAMDRQCGSDDAVKKKTEAERVKMMVEVDKARAKLLAQATASVK
ncbi:MAG TPA: hypothetical protein VFQ53_22640 [Kofleriaceae bacterium]|nr:hypothetical protein [Kofleriaceae bacterium]